MRDVVLQETTWGRKTKHLDRRTVDQTEPPLKKLTSLSRTVPSFGEPPPGAPPLPQHPLPRPQRRVLLFRYLGETQRQRRRRIPQPGAPAPPEKIPDRSASPCRRRKDRGDLAQDRKGAGGGCAGKGLRFPGLVIVSRPRIPTVLPLASSSSPLPSARMVG